MDAAEIDKELEALEHKAEHLRALYEQYFMGIDRVEPLVHRRDVERRIVVLRREQLRNTAQRFKFNTLVQRFNTMSQHWARVVREIENGTYRRDVIRAAARFGDGALAVLGKKKTKDLLAAVARAQEKSRPDDAFELGADDLIEEEEEEEDEVPTPPKLEARPSAPGGLQAPLPPSSGLGQGDLPVISAFAPEPAPAPRAPAAAAPPPAATGEAPKPPVQPAAAPPRLGGLRWGAPAPAAADDAKRRVAQLVAQVAPQRQSQPKAGGFGELDLDFEESPAAPAAPVPAPAAPKPLRPLPAAVAPPARPVVPAAVAPVRPVAPAPAAPAPAAPAMPAFGVLDIPLDEMPAPPRPEPSPAAAIRSAAMPRPAPKPAPAPAAPARPAGGEGDLSDQRIRQIYAKYVDAKRSTQESTAGVTFEKLAASLRAQADKLKSAHPNRAVDYEVVVKDGKTHLKPVLR